MAKSERKKKRLYRPLLVDVGTVLQQVHHAVKVSLSGGPDQRGGPILTHTHTDRGSDDGAMLMCRQ